MIEFKFIGLDKAREAIGRIRDVLNGNVLVGIVEAASMLADEIRSRAPNDEYANSVRVYYLDHEAIVGPDLSWVEAYEFGLSAGMRTYRCPWWRYLSFRERSQIQGSELLLQIVEEKMSDIGNIIWEKVRSAISGG